MNRYLLLSTALVPLFGTGCDKPKPDVSDRLTELEQRVATAEQEAAEARAAQQETERLLEEQRLAVERDALERDRIQLQQERAEKDRLLEEQARAAEDELRQREDSIAQREQSTIDLQNTLTDQQQALDQREAELSERDRELAGREALPDSAAAPAAAPDPDPVDVQVFYDSLAPYGSWFDSPDYGYVWRPAAYRTAGWRPYTHGRWACTDRGWMWISDEPFGWATYHYGRWTLCRTNGWIWIPGTEWAPSWVCWRTSGSHIGWAPLPPETLAYRGRRWDSSVEVTFGIGSAWFSFVDIGNFSRPIRGYCLPYTRNEYYWGNTVNITNIHIHNNRIISGGPSYGDIARQTDRRPPFYRIEEDRGGRDGKYPRVGQNRIQNGRVVVSPPRREESRNPDAVMNRPSRVSGRLDNVEVVRTKQLDQDIVRDFQKNREQSRKTGAQPQEVTQRPEETKPRDRGEEQRRLNERAQDLEKEARKNVDDRIRVLPRPAEDPTGGTSHPKRTDPTQPKPPTTANNRGEEQRRLNEKAQELEKEARKNVDDRIRILPRPADRTSEPRRDESRNQDNARQQEAQQQQRQAEEQQRRRAAEEQQRQQQKQQQAEESRRQQQAAEESRRQQQRQAEENSRRQAEAQRENQRRQEQAAEESRRQQQRQAEESQRQQQRQTEENSRRQEQQRQSEENSRRQEQQRQSEEQQRRNRR
jgi:hypothetical protein